MLYGVLLFVGSETAANLAEEAPNPRREIPIAVMTTAGIATVIYVLATYVEVAGFHYSVKTLTAAASAALAVTSRRHGSPLGAGAFVVGAAIVTLLMCVGSLRSFAASKRRVSLIVSAVVGIVIIGGAIFGSFYKVTSPTIEAPYYALALLVLGFASTYVLRARESASTQLADLSAEATR